ncbi:ABC transporter ATP-binding protein [Bacillus sp. FJAT-29937]|uniref:ABC transporter ATP-binding protein n=1 Tax=Bacillus sp. FJAT-29937 TaxID=1720553 RepID=UPI00082CF801|nr:ABC transporter ATP-binding protein [Bacillus sp. FJAT-29937]
MKKDTVISIDNISKEYKLYDNKIDRLKEAISISKKSYYKKFLALKDVSFDIKKGETIGLIGKNGSGKSTLLKILSGIIKPTTGSIKIDGKVSALLELGAGFNPEYTGLENIYLSGTILGFSKKEIDAKLDEIINFADIGEFIHHPVKLYSSGMFVRLAYAVQACIDPEILIVDEALAVGDAAFALKCMNHMRKLVNKGVTVILVTHDVQAIRSFCSRVIWLHEGKIRKIGNANEVTSEYVKELFLMDDENGAKTKKEENLIRWGNGRIQVVDSRIYDEKGEESEVIEWGEDITICLKARVNVDYVASDQIGFGFSFRNKHGLDIIVSTTYEEGERLGPLYRDQEITVNFKLKNILTSGEYALLLSIEDRSGTKPEYYDFIENIRILKVISGKRFFSLVQPKIEQNIIVNN